VDYLVLNRRLPDLKGRLALMERKVHRVLRAFKGSKVTPDRSGLRAFKVFRVRRVKPDRRGCKESRVTREIWVRRAYKGFLGQIHLSAKPQLMGSSTPARTPRGTLSPGAAEELRRSTCKTLTRA
jgi:hypothetical protein